VQNKHLLSNKRLSQAIKANFAFDSNIPKAVTLFMDDLNQAAPTHYAMSMPWEGVPEKQSCLFTSIRRVTI